MKIFKQLLKEFWLPFCAAAAWTAFSVWSDSFSLVKTISTFGPSFFLVSWVVGQFFRVRKQVGVESSLVNVEARLEKLASSLEVNVEKMVGHMNGGDSFCYVMPNGVQDGKRMWFLRHCGDYPLYKLSVRITDIDQLGRNVEQTFSWDEFSVNGMHLLRSLDVSGADTQSFNIFFHSRNGRVVQEVRFARVDGSEKWAYRLSRGYETLIQILPEGFPLGEADKRDWLAESGISGSQKHWSTEYQLQEHLLKPSEAMV